MSNNKRAETVEKDGRTYLVVKALSPGQKCCLTKKVLKEWDYPNDWAEVTQKGDTLIGLKEI